MKSADHFNPDSLRRMFDRLSEHPKPYVAYLSFHDDADIERFCERMGIARAENVPPMSAISGVPLRVRTETPAGVVEIGYREGAAMRFGIP